MANRKWLDAMNAIKHISNKPLLAGAFVLQRYSMENVREMDAVDTGFMLNSHFSKEESYGASTNVGAEYAHYVHFGTSKMPARRFLTVAGDEHQNEIVQAIEKQAAREIAQAARK